MFFMQYMPSITWFYLASVLVFILIKLKHNVLKLKIGYVEGSQAQDVYGVMCLFEED